MCIHTCVFIILQVWRGVAVLVFYFHVYLLESCVGVYSHLCVYFITSVERCGCSCVLFSCIPVVFTPVFVLCYRCGERQLSRCFTPCLYVLVVSSLRLHTTYSATTVSGRQM